jgi:hypothetical protein
MCSPLWCSMYVNFDTNFFSTAVKKFVEQCFAFELYSLRYLCGEVSKKGCLSGCPVERKENCTSVNEFLYFNLEVYVRVHQKSCQGKKSQKCNKFGQIALFNSKVALRASFFYCLFVFNFDLQSRIKL